MSFNFTFRYIDVLSLNDSRFSDYIDVIYPLELEVNDTTDSHNSATYLDLLLAIGDDNKLSTRLYDKRCDFTFSTVNSPICAATFLLLLLKVFVDLRNRDMFYQD